MKVSVALVGPEDVGSLRPFLEEALRGGEPFPEEFVERLGGAIQSQELEILAASVEDRVAGLAMISYRPSVSTAADFASVEELYVMPEARGRGVGRVLLGAVEERCADRGVSYVEVQTDDEAADFYAALGYEDESGVRVMARSLPIGFE